MGESLGISGSTTRQTLSLVLPIAALLGGGIAQQRAVVGGLLMLVSCAGILAVLDIGVFSLMTAIPIGLGGALAVFDGLGPGSES